MNPTLELEVADTAVTGRLRDERRYVLVWRGWQLQAYHWIAPATARWLDMMVALGRVPAVTAQALANHVGLPAPEIPGLIDDFVAKGVLREVATDASAVREAYRPIALNLGGLPHSAVEGHFNHELLRTDSPHFVKFEITTRCNLHCGYCYVKELPDEQVSYEQTVALLRKLRAGGVAELSLTGLESTLHPQIADIIVAADRLGFRTALLTNGLSLKPALLEALAMTRRAEVRISYHSNDDQQFDTFTKRKGSRRAIWANMLRLRDAGIPVVATVVLNKTNETLVRSTVADLISERIPYVVSNIILPFINGKLDPLASNTYLPSMGVVADLVIDGITHRRRRECTALRSKAWLSSNGDLFPCELTRGAPIGNLLEQDMLALWNSEASGRLRERYRAEPTPCGGCSAKGGCPRCPALAEAERGKPNEIYMPFCSTTAAVEERRRSTWAPPAAAAAAVAAPAPVPAAGLVQLKRGAPKAARPVND